MAGEDGISKHGLRRIYRILCFLAWCDDDMDPAERKLLEQYRTRFGIAELEGAMLEAEGKKGSALGLGDREPELVLLVDSMIDISCADGLLAVEEQERLVKLGKELGLSKGRLVGMMKRRLRKTGRVVEVEAKEEEED